MFSYSCVLMKKNMYDVIVVGAGPAGLTAAIYALRRTLKVLNISKDVGGQAALTEDIENYPGFDKVDGLVLSQKFQEQVIKFGGEIEYNEVKEIEKKDDFFVVKTANKDFEAKTVILAFGLTPRNLNVPGEERLTGKGVSYCATCDAPFYKGKVAAVAGGGNAALDAVEVLAKIASKIYMIHRREEFRGEEVLVQKVKELKNVEFVLSHIVKEVKGENKVEKIEVENIETGEIKNIEVNGIFVEIGHVVKADFLKGFVDLDERNHILVNSFCETNIDGIFACGDVTDIPYKQVVIAAGEGAKAALTAYKYLQQKEGKSVTVDWGNK